jgi:sulfur carrier protein ThiS
MKITLKLFASLADHLPPEARTNHTIDLDVDPGTTVMDVVLRQGIPEALCAIVLIDGVWVPRPDRARRALADGQVLAIWPPVAGGSRLRTARDSRSHGVVSFHRNLEMSLNREEFFRRLPAVVGSFGVDGETVRWSDGNRGWTIRLVPLADRRLGSVVVPRHRVEIALEACSEAEGEAFMDRFQRAFLRGGG